MKLRIDFGSNQLRKAYETYAAAERLWGTAIGRKYVQRIEAIYSAPEWEEVMRITTFHVHPLKGDRAGDWAIALSGKWRLIVIPADDGVSLMVKEVTNHYGD